MNASEQLIKAAKNGNVKEVRKLLSKGAFFTKDEFGNTALHEAAWTGNKDIVKILLKAGCLVDSVNGAGFTPLHLACQNGHAKVAKTLLKWKANPSLKNQHEENPIHLAAKYDHPHLIPVLAAAKVDLDVKAKDGNTALHIAAKLGYISTVKILIEHGADPNFSNMKCKLPIDYAEIGDFHDTVKLLIPLTKRPVVTSRRATLDNGTTRPRTPDIAQSGKKGSFNLPKLSKLDRKKYDSPQAIHEAGVRMRQRSTSSISPVTKRYSREFEDLPVRFGVGTSPLVRSQRSATRSPSIEELLEEVEKEAHGPDYKFIPPNSDDSEDSSSVTYRPLHRVRLTSDSSDTSLPATLTMNMSMPNLAAGAPHSRANSQSPLTKVPIYDYLSPRGTKCQLDNKDNGASPRVDDSYVCFRPSMDSTDITGTSPDAQESPIYSPTYSHPVLSDEVLRHQYEYLPPLSQEQSDKKDDAFDSYVYMAPRNDAHLLPQNVSPRVLLRSTSASFTTPTKQDVCSEARVKNFSPENNNKKTLKPYLSQQQFSENGKKRDSEIEKYLQEELETMRQTFQTRLSQIEKKYERKIASMSSASSRTDSLIEDNMARSSWHGEIEDEDEIFSDKVQDVNSLEKCQVSDFTSNEMSNGESVLDDEMKRLLQQRVEEYKKKMMQLFVEQAESQMASLELECEEKMLKLQHQKVQNNNIDKTSV